MQHLVFKLHDLPTSRHALFQPSRRAVEPSWLYRTIAYRYPNLVLGMNATWDAAVAYRLRSLVLKNEGTAGVTLRDGLPCGGGPGCVVDRALAHARDTVAWTGFDEASDFRAPKAIAPSDWASSADKATILYALLVHAGVDARLAGLVRAHTHEVDKAFPLLAWRNHTLVVARLGNEDIWLDPSCDLCGRGELTLWSRDRDSLAVFGNGDEMKIEWRRATGRAPALRDVRRTVHAVTLQEQGGAVVASTLSTAGGEALASCRDARDWDADHWRAAVRRVVKDFSRAGELFENKPGICQREGGTDERSLRARLPTFAAAWDDGLVVPLRLLVPPVSLPRRDARQTDFVVASPSERGDELRLVPPPGYAFASVPASFQQQHRRVLVRFELRCDGPALVLLRVVSLAAGATPQAEYPRVRAVLDAAAAVAVRAVSLQKTPGRGGLRRAAARDEAADEATVTSRVTPGQVAM